jgi:hypothetical protein
MLNAFKNPIEIHNELNPKLWNNETLFPEVRQALLRIAEEFYKFLEVDSIIYDIVITGSQTNYSYSEYSDIDLHLIIPFKNIACDEPIANLFDTKRKLWKEKHNIDIYEIPVETYVQDIDQLAIGSVYSIIENKWIDHPDIPKVEYNKDEVMHIVNIWNKIINIVLTSKKLSLCKMILSLLGKYRKIGLKQHGEFGVPNLVFKSLRNTKIIDNLSDMIHSLEDKNLSLDD